MIIGNRSYGSESSSEEREAIANRVTKISDEILLWEEVPRPSLLAVQLMEERLKELTRGLPRYCRVVDLSVAARPSAEVRRHLRTMLASEENLLHVAAFTQKNALINVALKFVFAGIAKETSLSVHRDFDEALTACRSALDSVASEPR